MSQFSFGFNPQDFGDEFNFNPQFASELFTQLGNMISQFGNSINSTEPVLSPENTTAEVIKVGIEKFGKDSTVSAEEISAAQSALSLANVWLNTSTIFPETASKISCWSPHQWIESTADTWVKLCSPLSHRSSSMFATQLPDEMQDFASVLNRVSDNVNSMNLINQLGSALAELAAQTYTSTDNGLVLSDNSYIPAIISSNITKFSESANIPKQELLVFMVLREAAHQRLHHAAPWLNSFFLHLLELYANEIQIDFNEITQQLNEIEFQGQPDFDRIQEFISEKLLGANNNEEQERLTGQLQDMLALIEGWVQSVIYTTVSDKLPHFQVMHEIIRRNILNSSGAHQTLAKLLGIELMPRRVEETSKFFNFVLEQKGQDTRDTMWSHPDLLPTPGEINSPQNYLARITQSPQDMAFDAELEKLLNSTDKNGTDVNKDDSKNSES